MKGKLRMNPILKKDLKVTARTLRFYLTIFIFEIILGIVFLMASSSFGYSYYSTNTERFEGFLYFFVIFGIVELVMVALIMPAITSSSISGEKEHQTFDILMTTAISHWRIVIGKLFSAVFHVMLFVIGSLPFLSVSFVIGGLSWSVLFEFLFLAFVFSIYAGSIGIFASAVCKKSKAAIILSLFLYSMLMGMNYLPLFAVALTDKDPFFSVLILLINPVMLFIEFFVKSLSGGDSLLTELFNSTHPLYGFVEGAGWIVVSTIAILAMSFLFMWLSVRLINPLKQSKK